jgi:hypothetical protein
MAISAPGFWTSVEAAVPQRILAAIIIRTPAAKPNRTKTPIRWLPPKARYR